MIRRLKYTEFKEFLLNDGYNCKEINYLFNKVKKFDKQILIWFIDWFKGKGLPTEIIEDVNMDYLINEYGLKTINAFIVLNWLKKDPEAAKYILLKQSKDTIISDTLQNDFQKLLNVDAIENHIENFNTDIEVKKHD